MSAEAQGLVILPMIISPSRFEKTPLARFQAINPPSRPLVGLSTSEQEAVFVQVANAVERALGSSTIEEESASESTSYPRDTFIAGDLMSGGNRIFWDRFKASWMLAGIGLAVLLVVLWLLIPSTQERIPPKAEQAEMKVQAEYGVAAGGDINAKDITISAPLSAPKNAD
jgi:hypothetical protein